MINIQITEADQEKPSTLRALALFLNTLAYERDGGKPVVRVTATSPTPVADEGNALTTGPDAVGASADSPSTDTADAPAEETTASGEGLDKNGLPWDGRIHSSSKNKNADGSWRYLRGVDKDLVGIVEAELRQLTSNDAPPPPPPVVEQPKADDAPPPPPPPVADDAPPPPPAVAGAVTVQDVFKRVTHLQKSGDENRMPQELLNECLSTVGLKSMVELMSKAKTEPELPAQLLEAINLVAGED